MVNFPYVLEYLISYEVNQCNLPLILILRSLAHILILHSLAQSISFDRNLLFIGMFWNIIDKITCIILR